MVCNHLPSLRQSPRSRSFFVASVSRSVQVDCGAGGNIKRISVCVDGCVWHYSACSLHVDWAIIAHPWRAAPVKSVDFFSRHIRFRVKVKPIGDHTKVPGPTGGRNVPSLQLGPSLGTFVSPLFWSSGVLGFLTRTQELSVTLALSQYETL